MHKRPAIGVALLAGLALLVTLAMPVARASTQPHAAAMVPSSILVRFELNASPQERAEARASVGGALVRTYQLVPGLEHLLISSEGMEATQATETLTQLPYVAYAEPDTVVHVAGAPNDPLFPNLWGMAAIHAPAAWDTFSGDPAVVVASIDTGIDIAHPDLAANIWTNPGEVPGDGVDNDANGYVDDVHGWDFAYRDNDPMDGFGHGTHTAGTMGAVGNNGIGVAGVNWNVKVMPLKFLNDNGNGTISNAIAALDYAVAEGARISSNSWGGGGYSQSMVDAIRNAGLAGHLFFAAAGNGGNDYVGDDNDLTPFYPASYNLDNIIAVASVDSALNKAGSSNYGATSVDLGAPGENILSTVPGGGYEYWGGTSMATPHIAGVAALILGMHPDWTYSQVRDKILGTTFPVPSLAGRTVTGGIVDAAAALSGPVPPTPTPTATHTPTPAPTPTPTITPTPTPSASIHVGDLDGIGSVVSSAKWKATVTIAVHDSNHAAISGAIVTGAWTNGATGTSSCVSDSSGQCSVVKSNLSRAKLVGVVFTVSSISLAGRTYVASANHDVDGGTNGTTVTVYRP